MHHAAAVSITIKIISGTRTYAQGRTKPGDKVTNARGGYSNHNFDIGVFEGTSYKDESPRYSAVGMLGEVLGLESGGHWKSFQEQPHYQLRPTWAATLTDRDMLTGLRRREDASLPVYA